MNDDIAPGTIVEHGTWGFGKVMANRAPYIDVYFPSLATDPRGGQRALRIDGTQLTIASVQSHPELDRITIGGRGKPGKKSGAGGGRVPPVEHDLEHAIKWFETTYPARFEDATLRAADTDFKRAAQKAFADLFGEGRGRQLLSSRSTDAIAAGLRHLYTSTDIPSPFEKLAAKGGLQDGEAASRLLEHLLNFLDQPTGEAFDAFTNAVATLPAASSKSKVLTWSNVTLLPFLASPERFLVLKPTVSLKLAARMKHDLLYSQAPAWHTFQAYQTLAGQLRERLTALGARDYIDVQSFVWATRDLE